jgi:erythronate-4-phosphate dehydrogenase
MMKIAVDENIPGVSETFSLHAEVTRVDGRLLRRADIRDMDALIVRSVTAVDSALLKGTSVRFVGSATIGTDHLDIPWLDQQGIRWANAPGCNANAAAEFTLAMILLSCRRTGMELASSRIGIVGLGNVGSRLWRLLTAFGLTQFYLCDPPLAETGVPGLCDFEQIRECNLVSFHVPLTVAGAHPTLGMANCQFLNSLPHGALLVNTSRGRVFDAEALNHWLAAGLGFAALDVFPREPVEDDSLIKLLSVATPHVAGYSLDGKWNGTLMVYREFCDWLQVGEHVSRPLPHLDDHRLTVQQASSVETAVLAACPVERDDRNIRETLTPAAASGGKLFDKLRRNYPERRDFAGWRVPENLPANRAATLRALGFH